MHPGIETGSSPPAQPVAQEPSCYPSQNDVARRELYSCRLCTLDELSKIEDVSGQPNAKPPEFIGKYNLSDGGKRPRARFDGTVTERPPPENRTGTEGRI